MVTDVRAEPVAPAQLTPSEISERTVEFAASHALHVALRSRTPNAAPFHFHVGREGRTLARPTSPEPGTRLLAVFPRRPRPAECAQELVRFKLNAVVQAFALEAHNLGIDTLVAVPVHHELAQYRHDAPCAFFAVLPRPPHFHEARAFRLVRCQTPAGGRAEEETIVGPLDGDDLAVRLSRPRPRPDIVGLAQDLRDLHRRVLSAHGLPFIPMYRPFYLWQAPDLIGARR